MAASIWELPGHHGSRKVLSRFRMRPAAPESSPRDRGTACENPETFDIRLREAIKTLESQILYQVEDWHRERQDITAPCDIFSDELVVEADTEEDEHQSGPSTCFVDFIADVKGIMNSYYDDYCRELETRFHKELTRVTTKNLHEVMHLRDRLAPWLRAIDLTCSDEDLVLYKPLERWSKEQQEIMKEMIEERLRQLLSLEQLRSTANKKVPEKVDESEVETYEPEPEEEDTEAEEEMRRRQKAAREEALAAAKEKSKNLENECEDLERQIAEMRARYKEAQGRSEEIRKRSKSLSAASDELDQPLPALLPEKQVKAIPVEGMRDVEGASVRSAREQAEEKAAAAAAKKAAADATKAAFDAELERCKKNALDMNNERWRKDLQGFTAKIKDLEEELSALMGSKEQREQAEQAGSVQGPRASTEVPGEFSRQTSAAASPEHAVPSSPTRVDPNDHHDAVRNWHVLRQKVHALGTTASVFDKLYQDTDVRKARIDETREKLAKEYEEHYNLTFVRHRPFGTTSGHQVDSLKYLSGASAYGSTNSDSLVRRTSALEFGSPVTKLKTVQSEPQFRVCLGGPLPPFDDWWDSAPQTGANTPQLGSLGLVGASTHKAKEGITLSLSEASLRAGSQKPLRLEQLSANVENTSSSLRSGRNNLGKEARGRIDGERSHRTNAPYDILKPTLKQVEVQAKLPTALSRMAAEEDECDKDAKADAQHESVGAGNKGDAEDNDEKKQKITGNEDAKLDKGKQSAKAKAVAKTKAKAKAKAKAKSKAINEDEDDESEDESESVEDDVEDDDEDDEDNQEDDEDFDDENHEDEEDGAEDENDEDEEDGAEDDDEDKETEDEDDDSENAPKRLKAKTKSKAKALKAKAKASPAKLSSGKSLPVQGKAIKTKPANS